MVWPDIHFLQSAKAAMNSLHLGVPFMAQQLAHLIRIHEDADSILGLAQWVKDLALL